MPSEETMREKTRGMSVEIFNVKVARNKRRTMRANSLSIYDSFKQLHNPLEVYNADKILLSWKIEVNHFVKARLLITFIDTHCHSFTSFKAAKSDFPANRVRRLQEIEWGKPDSINDIESLFRVKSWKKNGSISTLSRKIWFQSHDDNAGREKWTQGLWRACGLPRAILWAFRHGTKQGCGFVVLEMELEHWVGLWLANISTSERPSQHGLFICEAKNCFLINRIEFNLYWNFAQFCFVLSNVTTESPKSRCLLSFTVKEKQTRAGQGLFICLESHYLNVIFKSTGSDQIK